MVFRMSKLSIVRQFLSRTIPKNLIPSMLIAACIVQICLTCCSKPQDRIPTDISSYKKAVDAVISPEKIENTLKYLTSVPHVAASPRNNELAEFVRDEWKNFGLEDVHIVPYDVLLSFPEKIHIELLSPKKYILNLREQSYEEDPDTKRTDVGIPYNAYSRSGDVTAPLVYANAGNPQDYDYLESQGIDIKGKIALVRYSAPYSYRGFKAYTAERRGLAALLIFSDPKDDGYAKGPVFPEGPWGPFSHIQRGGIPYDFIYPGDPLTPEWASTPGCSRISLEESPIIPNIISVPISAEDALPLLESMDGEEAPESWWGALPVKYRIHGSESKVHITVNMRDPIERITNVLGSIKGLENPDEVILVGNHRDAWVFGGHDPSSGTACLMELARAFAEAKKEGWRPRRTVMFANWDAEEFTLTGSTEWGEDNRDWLVKNLVAYINVDSSACGKNFSVQAVPCLSPLIIQTMKEVNDPATNLSVFDCWLKGPSERGTIGISSGSGKIDPIGSGTDHAVFLNHIGAPALNMTFSGDYGVYHSMYDNYYWMNHFGDPGMLYTATLAKMWAHMIIELACNPIIPLDYEVYTQELMRYLEEWAELHDPSREQSENLKSLLRGMEKSASALTPYLIEKIELAGRISEENIQKANRLLIRIERDFTDLEGIPKRKWYKHLVFGARFTYDDLLFPSLTEAAEEGNMEGVRQSLLNLENCVKKATSKLEQIADALNVR
jgi:N-acetylated-alpha-linked acidic dipeptidase